MDVYEAAPNSLEPFLHIFALLKEPAILESPYHARGTFVLAIVAISIVSVAFVAVHLTGLRNALVSTFDSAKDSINHGTASIGSGIKQAANSKSSSLGPATVYTGSALNVRVKATRNAAPRYTTLGVPRVRRFLSRLQSNMCSEAGGCAICASHFTDGAPSAALPAQEAGLRRVF